MIVWDEKKRIANLEKHGLDFAASHLVYDSPDKLTITAVRNNEARSMDIALIEYLGMVLALIYVQRGDDIRAISLRRASRKERKLYEEACRQDGLGKGKA